MALRSPRSLTLLEMQSCFDGVIRELNDLLTLKRVDWNQRRITNAADAVNPGDYVTLRQLEETLENFATVAGLNVPLAYFGGPAEVGIALGEGTSLLSSRADHVHRIKVNSKTLTNGTYTSVFEIALESGAMCGGAVDFLIRASDGTDHVTESGSLYYSAQNKAGAYITGINKGPWTETPGVASLETLFQVTTGTNKVIVQCKATATGITPTTLDIRYVLQELSTQTVTLL